MRACNLLPAPGELRDGGKPTVPRAGYCPGRGVLGLGLTPLRAPAEGLSSPHAAWQLKASSREPSLRPGGLVPNGDARPHLLQAAPLTASLPPSCRKGLGPTVLPRQEQTPHDLKLSHGAAVSGVPGPPRGCGGKLPHSLLGLLKQESSAIRPGAASPLMAEGGRSCRAGVWQQPQQGAPAHRPQAGRFQRRAAGAAQLQAVCRASAPRRPAAS